MPFINRCGDAPKLQTKTVTPSTSQQIITPDTGYEGLEKVVVNAPIYQTKTVTADGTVTADEGYSGLGSVIVNVPYNMLYVEMLASDTSSNGAASLEFELGDAMNYHSSNPDRIIISTLSHIAKYSSGNTANIYGSIYGADLLRYSNNQYIGKLYVENTNYTYKYDNYKGSIASIKESDVDTGSNDKSVGVTYDAATKKISISILNVALYMGDPFTNIRFKAPSGSASVPYGGYFIWY